MAVPTPNVADIIHGELAEYMGDIERYRAQSPGDKQAEHRGWWIGDDHQVASMRSPLDFGDVRGDVIRVVCGDCGGTGIFVMPDDEHVVDVACRGRGWVPAGLIGQDFV